MVAQQRQQPPIDRFALDHLEWWWGHLARAGLDTLADGASLDVFEQALLDAPPWPTATGPAWSRPLSANGRERHAVADGAGLNQLAQDLAAEGLRQRLAGRLDRHDRRGGRGHGRRRRLHARGRPAFGDGVCRPVDRGLVSQDKRACRGRVSSAPGRVTSPGSPTQTAIAL